LPNPFRIIQHKKNKHAFFTGEKQQTCDEMRTSVSNYPK